MSIRPYTPGWWMPMDTPTLVSAITGVRAQAASAKANSFFMSVFLQSVMLSQRGQAPCRGQGLAPCLHLHRFSPERGCLGFSARAMGRLSEGAGGESGHYGREGKGLGHEVAWVVADVGSTR